jgi:two-component system, cell cycle sensor histidine kinase and response regulator CckA
MQEHDNTSRFGPLPFVLLGILGLVLLVGVLLFQKQQEHHRSMVEDQLQAIATLQSEGIATWRQGLLDQAASLSESPFLAQGVQRYLEEYRLDRAQTLLQRLRSMTTHYHYLGVLLVDNAGNVAASSGEIAQFDQGGTLAELAGRAMHERRAVLGDLFRPTASDRVYIAVAAPLYEDGEAEKQLLGTFVLIGDPQRFLYPLLQNWPIPSDSAESSLVRGEGEEVVFLKPLRHLSDPPLSLRLPKSHVEVPAVAAVSGQSGIVTGPDYRGREVIAYVQAIPASPWFLVCKIDHQEAFSQWRKQSALLIFTFSSLAALLIAFGLALRQRNRRRYYRELLTVEQQLRRTAERSSFVLRSINDAILVTNSFGRINLANPAAVELLSDKKSDPVGQRLEELVTFINESSGQPLDSPVTAVLGDSRERYSARSAMLCRPDHSRIAVAIDAAPLHDGEGRVDGVVVVLHDRSRARSMARLTEKRIKISEFANSSSLDQLLVRVLDEICDLVDSPIGFFHFVEADQQTLSLQAWSTRTQQEFCHAEGRGRHYDIAQAGVWVDCIRRRQAVIHNDYAGLPHKKGLPPGHAPVVRELVVPVLQNDKVVAILGVGNKPGDYNESDVEAVSYLSEVVFHIIEAKRAEAEKDKIHGQLQQAQKMESVGRLAGGVAHDFNNMLSVIIGNTELALEYAKKDSAMQRELLEIKTAALRSADLTRQLLAFARKQAVAPRVVNLNETIEGMLKMLRRLIGEDIQLAWLPQSGLPQVFIDPSQVDQILANLCVNARDAIRGVGKVIIETATTTLSEEYCRDNPGTTPGDYVSLSLSDTGTGIPKEQLPHIFEPFFTTKKQGEGTGLGLAMVYGIVKQNGGFIKVYSEPGQGTTFRISLPQHHGDTGAAPNEEVEEIPQGQGQLILLVEDETVILEMNSRILQRLGYRVIASSSTSEAIALAHQHREELQLLLTDIIMPEMNGYDLSQVILGDNPQLKVLFISGYTANVIARQGVLPEGMNFLQKPFMKRDLAKKLHHILNG